MSHLRIKTSASPASPNTAIFNTPRSPTLAYSPTTPNSPVTPSADVYDHLISTGVSLEDTTALLIQVCLNANVIGLSGKEDERVLKQLTEIKDIFLLHQHDLQTYQSVENTLNSAMFDFHVAITKLNNKLTILKNSSFLPSYSKKRKLDRRLSEVKECWNRMFMILTMTMATKSSQAATQASGNVAKLAIAQGHPDWDVLDPNDAVKLCTQGDKHLFGYGVTKSPEIALKRYNLAAKNGYAPACVMLGALYEYGIGHSSDLSMAVYWYKMAAERNSAEGCTALGRLYEHGIGLERDLSKASEWYLKAAELGDLEAMTCLGNLLEAGPSPINIDSEKAYHWYSLAANQGYARAQNCLGGLLYKGIGCSQDYLKAAQEFRKAAEQGNAAAMNNLGICYEEGRGVARDYVLAKLWYKSAHERGHASGTNNLGYMFLVENNVFEAFQLFNLAMSLGSVDAIYNLGALYENGSKGNHSALLGSVPTIDTFLPSDLLPFSIIADQRSAFQYYKMAAEKGHEKAMIKAAEMALHGRGIPKNLKLSSHFYFLAATTFSNPIAENALGELHEIGAISAEPNPNEAKKWYAKAMKNGFAKAIFNLGKLYESGLAVERDLDKAVKLYVEASKRGDQRAKQRMEELKDLVQERQVSEVKGKRANFSL
ncbi:hypothetical protein BKA69DRAFT_1054815 [Paraphysoderma sedebokerense]|nr:hypothetical protein BKA69DRAFT_1058560 [Paraphysoderma sedebokerense]KAI9144399.1 hypothetical protein BKA69DRAFT_1054815 [Paraphysoderma sedebokerense]